MKKKRISKNSLDYYLILDTLRTMGIEKKTPAFYKTFNELEAMMLLMNEHLERAKMGEIKPNKQAMRKIEATHEYNLIYQNKVKFDAIMTKWKKLLSISWHGDELEFFEQNKTLNKLISKILELDKEFGEVLGNEQ